MRCGAQSGRRAVFVSGIRAAILLLLPALVAAGEVARFDGGGGGGGALRDQSVISQSEYPWSSDGSLDASYGTSEEDGGVWGAQDEQAAYDGVRARDGGGRERLGEEEEAVAASEDRAATKKVQVPKSFSLCPDA